MGLFDSWRRRKKKKSRTTVKAREIMTPSTPMPEKGITPPDVDELDPETQGELVKLVADYERLQKRREKLQDERSALTERLDKGELTAIEFRKELMSRIQEAATVSEELKETAAKLTSMGYRGILH